MHAAPAGPRVIRLFVSSTFSDMQAERDELVKRVFPQLRRLCEHRGVHWTDVDLRWGVTDEQKAEGQVLPVCLAEIKNCRPWFIGLLGERYGWVPDHVSPELVAQEPWLSEHVGRDGRSVTELEIFHGVLNDPAMAGHAFFYIRDPAYIDALPAGVREAFREHPTAEEVERLGPEEAQRRAARRREKLATMKARICRSGFPVRLDVRDPHALGDMVLRDITGVIDCLFPEDATPDPLDRDAAEHEAFAESRSRVYVDPKSLVERLDAHARDSGPPLVLLGASGSGKSALLANWAGRYRTDHPDDLLLMHFIGATPMSANWVAMLRRFLGEFRRQAGVEREIPDEPGALREAFADVLRQVAAHRRVILIIDALDGLEDRDQALDLTWLPEEVPSGVRLYLSTLPGRPLQDLVRRGWPTVHIEPLDIEERSRLTVAYLGQFAKTLSPSRVDRIAGSSQAANPLYLRTLLEELRVWGDHFTLDARIEHYLKATSVDALYELVLERFEQDYEHGRHGLVREALSLLWAARRGLSESELLDLLGVDGSPLPRAYWSPLFIAADAALVSRSGLVTFSHDYLRRAVQGRYLPDDADRRSAHMRLADYFALRPPGTRRTEELPWQLGRGESWERLVDLLGELDFFAGLFRTDKYGLVNYWLDVEHHCPARVLDALMTSATQAGADGDGLGYAAEFLDYRGHLERAIQVSRLQVDAYRQHANLPGLQHALGNLAGMLIKSGAEDQAAALVEEAEALSRSRGDMRGLQHVLGLRACLLSRSGDIQQASALEDERERFYREHGDKGELWECLVNKAIRLKSTGNYGPALSVLAEAESLCREVGHRSGMLQVIGERAYISYHQGDLAGALGLFGELERRGRELGAPVARRVAQTWQAKILDELREQQRSGTKSGSVQWRNVMNVAARVLLMASVLCTTVWLALRFVYQPLAGVHPILAVVANTVAVLGSWIVLFALTLLGSSLWRGRRKSPRDRMP
jgi:hypothetical protein